MHTHPQHHDDDDDDDDDGITELLNPSSFSSYYMLTDILSLSLSLSLALILGSVCPPSQIHNRMDRPNI